MKSNIVPKGNGAVMQNMKMRNEMKFPIASIFMLLFMFVYIKELLRRWRIFRGFHFSILSEYMVFVVLLLDVLLVVLLFMRKRNNLLFVILSLRALCSVVCFVYAFRLASRIAIFAYREYLGFFIVLYSTFLMEFICFLLLGVESKISIWQNGKKNLLCHMWFIPCVLSVLISVLYYISREQSFRGSVMGVLWGINQIKIVGSDMTFLILQVLFVPMISTLSWWLTHPYKKENVVYQSPVGQPYVQRNDIPPTAFTNTLPKVFCTNCGRELSPDEDFCGVCGTKRAAFVQNVQPQFQQPIKIEDPVYQVPVTQPKVFCTECGRELSPDEEFCSVCGTKSYRN